MSDQLIIVGAGQAAAQAVQTLTQNDYAGRITVLGEEPYPPYQRPPLSKKYLAGELERARLSIRPPSFYEQRRVTLMLGERVERIERDSHCAYTEGGDKLDYDKLLIATGSRVRRLQVPGATLDGIHYLRGIDDADRIAEELVSRERLVVVGAGYIGLEVAAVARSRGATVTVLEAGDRIMARVVSPAVSDFYESVHRRAGVEIRCACPVQAFEGRKRVEAVVAADGSVHACDYVVAGIGISPATGLAENAGLACDDGILVDAAARTSDKDVFAAGDCTNHPNALYGRRVRLESVHNAIEQSKIAALSLLGRNEAYTQVPWFWSDQYDLKLQIAGLSQGYDAVAVRGDPNERHFAAYYGRGGRLIAVDAVNSPKDFVLGKKLIAARMQIDVNRLADSATDLEALARERVS